MKKIITGLDDPQEYCCIGLDTLPAPVKVVLSVSGDHEHIDVTADHLFLGYKPLIIGLCVSHQSALSKRLDSTDEITLQINQPANEGHAGLDNIATLKLRKDAKQVLNVELTLWIFEGVHGYHHFIGGIHQIINGVKAKLRKSAKENVNLPGNLQEQIRIAYAVPRTIAVITTSDGALINMFPTDLHGPASIDFYISSLRTGGLAYEQVITHRNILISEMDASFYKTVYGMGKNHMRMLSEPRQFDLSGHHSPTFNLPVPNGAISYRELAQVGVIEQGIHRLLIYKTIQQGRISTSGNVLAHLHQYYVQWRNDHGFETPWLVR